MNVVTRGLRNAFRNVTRTVSIVLILGLSIGLSLAMLVAHQAVQNKVSAALSSIGTTITIVPADYTNGGSLTNALTTAQLRKLKSLRHITRLTEALSGTMTTGSSGAGSSPVANLTSLKSVITVLFQPNNPGATPSKSAAPVMIWGTTDPTHLTDGGRVRIVDGEQISGAKDTNGALISTAMAKKNGLKVGSTFTAYGQTLRVSGIFVSPDGTLPDRDTVITSLATYQRISGSKDYVTSATATVDSLANLRSVSSRIKHTLGSSASVNSNVSEANDALQPLNSVATISLYSLMAAVAAGAVIILLTMIMIVRERRREVGILKAIGFGDVRTMLQFISEALTFTLLGAVVGLGLGLVAAGPVTSSLVRSSSGSELGHPMAISSSSAALQGLTTVQTQIGYGVILYGLAVAIAIALIGSALPSLLISRVRPAEVLRSE